MTTNQEETIAKVLNIFEERERMLAKGVTWRTDNPGHHAKHHVCSAR